MGAENLKTVTEVEAFIAERATSCGGHLKVNLDRGRGAQGNGEGVWAVAATPEDRAVYDDETSRGKKLKVYLCNAPLGEDGWHGRRWGCPVVATTFGENRPVAFAVDQGPLDEEVTAIKAVLDQAREQEVSDAAG